MRYLYGASPADYVVRQVDVASVSEGTVKAAVVDTTQPSVPIWDAPGGGSQVTDLLAVDGTTEVSSAPVQADGSFPFYGPHGDPVTLYAEGTGGRWYRLNPSQEGDLLTAATAAAANAQTAAAAAYVRPAGGIPKGDLAAPVTGTLDTVDAATAAATASRIAKRDTAGRLQVATPAVAGDVATKGYVDQAVVGGGGGSGPVPIVDVATSRALALADAYKLLRVDSATHVALVVPADVSVGFPVGTWIDIVRWGAGDVEVTGAGLASSTTRRNRFEGGSDGTAITTANSAAGGDPFDEVLACVFEDAAAAEGTMGMRASLSSSTESYVGWDWTHGDTVAVRTVWSCPLSPPNHNVRLVRAVQIGGAPAFEIRFNQAGEVDVIETDGSQAGILTDVNGVNYTPAAGTTYTVEALVDTATGAWEAYLYSGHWRGSGSPLASASGTGVFAAVAKVRFGDMTGSTPVSSAYIDHDDIAVHTSLPISSTAAVPVRSVSGELNLAAQYAGARLTKVGPDDWLLVGRLA